MGSFGTISERMARYREEMLSTKPRVCVERAVLTTQAYQENMNQPLAIKRANMLAKVLDNMTI